MFSKADVGSYTVFMEWLEEEKVKAKVAFKANYESMINGGEAVSKFGERKMFRDIIENQIMIDF